MTINNNAGDKSLVGKDLITNILKDILREDKLDVLVSMINNGLDINDFSYNKSNGLNAMIEFKLDCNDNGIGETLKYLLEKFQDETINDSNKEKLANLLLNNKDITNDIESMINDFADFIYEGGKALCNLKDSDDDKSVVFSNFGDFAEFLTNKVLNSVKESNSKEKNSCSETEVNNKVEDTVEDKTSSTNTNIAVDCGNARVKASAMLSPAELFLHRAEELRNIKSQTNIEGDDMSDNTIAPSTLDSDEVLVSDLDETSEGNSFDILGESNYQVSSITSYVTLENSSTYETEQFSIQVKDVEDLQHQINQKIVELNNKNDEKIVESLVDMMRTNSQFKKDLLNMMREAQVKAF